MTNSPTAQVDSKNAPIRPTWRWGSSPVQVVWRRDSQPDLPELESIHGSQHTCRSHCDHWVHDLTRGLSSKRLPICNKRVSLVGLLMCERSAASQDIWAAGRGNQRQSERYLRLLLSLARWSASTSKDNSARSEFCRIEPSRLYMKQMAERLHQSFSNYERVDANVPAGNSAEMWFDVNRDGSLSNIRIGKPSGWNSLDYACVRAVQRTGTVGPLPEDYKRRTLPASFACTYNWQQCLTNIHVS